MCHVGSLYLNHNMVTATFSKKETFQGRRLLLTPFLSEESRCTEIEAGSYMDCLYPSQTSTTETGMQDNRHAGMHNDVRVIKA